MTQTVVAPLKRGDFFGESALLKNAKRMATITAKSTLECLTLGRDLFSRLFDGKRFNVQFAKRNAVSAEKSVDPKEGANKNLIRNKDDSVRKLLVTAIVNNVVFKNLDAEQLRGIVEEMHLVEIKKGIEIIRQGAIADNFYVVEKGNFDVFVARDGEPTNKVATRGAGTSFGEMALLYNSPRAATIVATVDSQVWAIDRIPFRRILAKSTHKKLSDYENFLAQVQEFKGLSSHERSKIAEALEETNFPAKQIICKQGDAGDTFFIIKSGSVRIDKTTNGISELVGELGPGKYFGELALRRSEPRAATVTAIEAVVCLCMDHYSFVNLMGPLDEILQKQEAVYALPSARGAAPSATRTISRLSEEKLDDFETKIAKKDLKVVGTLGKGSFGIVQLVKDSTGKTYALKGISKVQVIHLGQQEHVMSEKNVMVALRHPFLIRLYSTYKDANAIFFLLEPCLGGELFTILRSRQSFNEQTAQFYAACVVSAFEYMHSKNIVYRDLKPENLLLDDKGYIKITDFGFAKVVTDRTFTLCGTPDYLAPEVVSGQGHGKGVDWWCLGILIFEMLASYPPFYDEDPMRTYSKIMHGQYACPKHFSADAVDLIKKLLHPKPTKRLGVIKGGATLIKEHPWFKSMNWEALEKRTLPCPIPVKISHSEDLTNFEDYGDLKHDFPIYKVGKEDPNWDADF